MNLQYTYYTNRQLAEMWQLTRQGAHLRMQQMHNVKTQDGYILLPEWALTDGEPPTEEAKQEITYLERCATVQCRNRQRPMSRARFRGLMETAGVKPVVIDEMEFLHDNDMDKLPKGRTRAKGEKEPVEVSLWYWHGRISKRGYELLEEQRGKLMHQYDLTTVEANSAIVAAGLDLLAAVVDDELIQAWRAGYKDVEPNGKRTQSPRIGLTPEQTQRFEELRKQHNISQARMVDLAIYASAHLTQNT